MDEELLEPSGCGNGNAAGRGIYQLVRPGYGEKFRDAVKEVMAKVCANPSAFTPKRRGVRKACFKSPFPYAVYYYEREEDIVVLAYAHEKRRPGYWRYRLRDV